MQWSLVERGTATGSGKCARRRGVIGFLAASSSGEVIYESNDELVSSSRTPRRIPAQAEVDVGRRTGVLPHNTYWEDSMQADVYRYIEWIWIAVGIVWLIAALVQTNRAPRGLDLPPGTHCDHDRSLWAALQRHSAPGPGRQLKRLRDRQAGSPAHPPRTLRDRPPSDLLRRSARAARHE